jgi:hypothetical protein
MTFVPIRSRLQEVSSPVLGPLVIFICCLFNDAVSSSVYIASNARVINEELIGKNVEGSARG